MKSVFVFQYFEYRHFHSIIIDFLNLRIIKFNRKRIRRRSVKMTNGKILRMQYFTYVITHSSTSQPPKVSTGDGTCAADNQNNHAHSHFECS